MKDLMILVWDVLMPKVTGGGGTWKKNHRYYGLMSTHGPKPTTKDPDPSPYVHHSSEAYLLWAWENFYDRWVCIHELENKNPKEDPNKKTEEGKYSDPRMETPYTNANGGQQPFGGVTQLGKDRLYELQDLVFENREKRAEEVKELEQKFLLLVREKNDRDQIDANRLKKKKTKVTVPMADNEEDSDDEDDNDFDKW